MGFLDRVFSGSSSSRHQDWRAMMSTAHRLADEHRFDEAAKYVEGAIATAKSKQDRLEAAAGVYHSEKPDYFSGYVYLAAEAVKAGEYRLAEGFLGQAEYHWRRTYEPNTTPGQIQRDKLDWSLGTCKFFDQWGDAISIGDGYYYLAQMWPEDWDPNWRYILAQAKRVAPQWNSWWDLDNIAGRCSSCRKFITKDRATDPLLGRWCPHCHTPL